MQLQKIKLAGFKSFVDPTTLNLPSRLIGIVGPNGCGKSNTIDAVRWVMGESSAKHLRGDSMEDVIFNGSNARKPVGKASIELVFDNSDGRAGGEYAKYNQISIRREVTRDGQSTYYLNNARCRRRDITDLFLGTGLGPRSYSIIEQGMISRLIEAKPQDMRVFLEEAAGISRYKERRRETENRMRHTRENLDRLNDLRDEIAKQLAHLERQSKAAEKYKVFKAEERQLKAQLLLLRLRAMDEQLRAREAEVAERETRLEKTVAEIRHCEAEIEKLREQRNEASESHNAVQAAFYQLGGEINSIEQTIQHRRELLERRRQEQNEASQLLSQARADIERDQAALANLERDIAALEPEVEAGSRDLDQVRQKLAEAERRMTDWQQRWEAFNERIAGPTQLAQVERARMEQLEKQIAQQQARLKRLEEEQGRIQTTQLESEISDLATRVAAQQQGQQQASELLESTAAALREVRERIKATAEQLNALQQQSQQARGRLASLEALQQAALGKDSQQLARWLARAGLQQAARLGERISAEPEWSRAVETVLGEVLEAVEVDSLDAPRDHFDALGDAPLALYENTTSAPAGGDSLWGKVKAPDCVRDLLQRVRLAGDLDDALRQRGGLGEGESVITPEGVWLGRSWLRFPGKADERAGVLDRKREIAELQAQLADYDRKTAALRQQLDAERKQQAELEAQRDARQNEANQAHREFSTLNARLEQNRSRLEQSTQRLASLRDEAEELARQLDQTREAHQRATESRNAAISEMESLQQQRGDFDSERETLRQQLSEARHALETARAALHDKQLKLQSLKTARDATRNNLTRMEQQREGLDSRLKALAEDLDQGEAPLQSLAEQLEALLGQRVGREQALHAARDALQDIDNQIREQEKQRHEAEERHNQMREALERLRLNAQELKVRSRTLEEQLAEMEMTRETAGAELDEDATIDAWEQRLEQLGRRIQRLGAINLAAIDEFQEQSERKQHLDAQYEDLTEALETLETAIRKIDNETRERFKETFDKVNESLKQKFPKLFGGGHAHLEMTEDDLLTTGVNVMARPPGKRVSNIHLLSGGEKALTAVALVFSIFELNPAPFCMLDEVDAPLDDANVGRFCNLVEEMSENVQFIFITHNKITMELARQLIGVTMREPGVSRLVDVDVDEAALMAAS